MNDFLKNKKTGQIVTRNIYNEKDPDLLPCIAPWEKPALGGGLVGDPPLDEASDLLNKDVAEAFVSEWFGQPVGDVKKEEMLQYALECGANATVRNNKLEIITAIYKAKNPKAPEPQE